MSRRRSLSVVQEEGLGRATIMSRSLASRHGVPFVRMAAMAIDLDRICEEVDDEDAQWPFGWEVFLLARYLEDAIDPTARQELVEEACVLAIELGDVLGAQLPFAVYELVSRERWPDALRGTFSDWKRPPRELSKRLAPLWADAEAETRRLAVACLGEPLSPPLSPPVREALERMSG